MWDGEDGKDDGEKWDRLKELLPRDAVGSKIVVYYTFSCNCQIHKHNRTTCFKRSVCR